MQTEEMWTLVKHCKPPIGRFAPAEPLMCSEMLILAMLEWDHEASFSDLAFSFRIGQSLSMDAQSRTPFILHSEQVESWIAKSSNQYQVVNVLQGKADVTHSTASFFSALLLRALDSTNPGVKLQWFCGQHHREDPGAMALDLLGQLVHHGLKNVHHARLPDLDELSADFESICDFFFACLSLQLEEGPVYCVLDSASLYEDKRRIGDLLLLVAGMTQLSGKFPLKLLITSPMQCSFLGTFRDGMKPSVLWVPQVVPPSWR
ncbi:hypothetical protein PRZ48_009338 [Zasmidium cellare]|uniref:Uncharacterized protein n=1 Tax=Zasmidium cellare TaxID=395010 RepID=A0ABR0EC87_ZASCE|nr:hypothetical protein PRZ48_009338 [Zasmidium cellare]